MYCNSFFSSLVTSTSALAAKFEKAEIVENIPIVDVGGSHEITFFKPDGGAFVGVLFYWLDFFLWTFSFAGIGLTMYFFSRFLSYLCGVPGFYASEVVSPMVSGLV